jgi:hypothetical protein
MLPESTECVWAEVVAGDLRLGLFSGQTWCGAVAALGDMRSLTWLSREWANDIEDGKKRAAQLAKAHLGVVSGSLDLPALEWKPAGQK